MIGTFTLQELGMQTFAARAQLDPRPRLGWAGWVAFLIATAGLVSWAAFEVSAQGQSEAAQRRVDVEEESPIPAMIPARQATAAAFCIGSATFGAHGGLRGRLVESLR